MEHTALTFSVLETAKLIGIKRSTAYEEVNSGAIPSEVVGKRRRVGIGTIAKLTGLSVDEVRALAAEVLRAPAA